MSSTIEKHLSYVFISDPQGGAVNVSPDGDAFTVQLNNPIVIPHKALSCSLVLLQAEIWNVVPNISAKIGNNTLYIYTDYVPLTDPPTAPNPQNVQIVIPDGLYSLDGLNSFIGSALTNLDLPVNLITLSSDSATQTVVINFNYDNTQLDFTQSNTLNEILGFNSRLVPLVLEPAVHIEFGDNPAKFNRTDSFIIKGDLISNGIPFNNINSGVLASIPITAKAGSQIVYAPYNPIVIDCDELIGKSKSNFSFQLTDQLNRNVDTVGEIWSFSVQISYFIKV
jgi:hypothetical protein